MVWAFSVLSMVDKKRAVKLLQSLVCINSENPPCDCRKIAALVKKEMESAGLSVKTYTFKKNAPTRVGTLKGSGKGKRKSLLLMPHMDTVPAGKGWKHDPFAAKIVGGKIYGRGTQDCKIHVAACIEAIRSIVESGTKLEGDLVVAMIPDEETGSESLGKLLEKKIINPDFALILDGCAFRAITVQKGLVQMRVEVFGKKAHAAWPTLGTNAIGQSAGIISDLSCLQFNFKAHPLLTGPTLNVGKIKGGEMVNMVADHCEFDVDIRYLPGMSYSAIMRQVRSIISKHTKAYKITLTDHKEPYLADKDLPPVKLLLSCMNQHRKTLLAGSPGVNEKVFFEKRNAVSIGFGPENMAHVTDEYVRLEDLYEGTAALEDFIRAHLGVVGKTKR